jgi:hypothetical protein
MAKRLIVKTTMVAMILLVAIGYAARDTQVMAHWHPMFVEPALGYFGISFFGHEHARHVHPAKGGAFTDGAPVTSCWRYDFLEKDCDGPDHYKALVSGTRIGAYKGDTWGSSPPRAKACAVAARRVCVSDWRDDGKTVWREAGARIEEHTLAIGCPGPRLEYPCSSRD